MIMAGWTSLFAWKKSSLQNHWTEQTTSWWFFYSWSVAKCKVGPEGGARWRVRKSTKSLGFVIWGAGILTVWRFTPLAKPAVWLWGPAAGQGREHRRLSARKQAEPNMYSLWLLKWRRCMPERNRQQQHLQHAVATRLLAGLRLLETPNVTLICPNRTSQPAYDTTRWIKTQKSKCDSPQSCSQRKLLSRTGSAAGSKC